MSGIGIAVVAQWDGILDPLLYDAADIAVHFENKVNHSNHSHEIDWFSVTENFC
jgi:hypothetical protein